MAVKLIGSASEGALSLPAAYVMGCQWPCSVAGTLTSMKVYCLVNSNVRVAIYTDSGSNTLGNLIAESASTAITSGDWRSIDVAGGAIIAGTKYWLMEQVQTTGGIAYAAGSLLRCYKAQAYGAFPANGAGFTHDSNYDYSMQGWGTAAAAGFSKGFIIG